MRAVGGADARADAGREAGPVHGRGQEDAHLGEGRRLSAEVSQRQITELGAVLRRALAD
ncbi:hypothetical protein AABB02_00700 [Streptomyces rimosus]|uniref:hypothetical protein n=1 Tax=Streptomyces rimosus TaxID=1927 RepID=UPI0031E37CAE